MDSFWFWLLVALLLVAAFTLPVWPYTRYHGIYLRGGAWRYAWPGAALSCVLLILLLSWFGLIGIAMPWAATNGVIN